MDIRSERTRKMLVDALEELLADKSIEEINIRELCDKSTVRRATFYRHFEDKYDFYRYYLQTLTAKFLEDAAGSFEGTQSDGLEAYADSMHAQLITFLEGNPSIAKMTLGNMALAGTLDMTMRQIAIGIAEKIEEEAAARKVALPTSSELISTIYAGGMVHSLRWWLGNGKPVDANELVRMNTEMLMRCIKG